MKACPVCHARTFDDAEVCYGCMHRYEGDAMCGRAAVGDGAWEPDGVFGARDLARPVPPLSEKPVAPEYPAAFGQEIPFGHMATPAQSVGRGRSEEPAKPTEPGRAVPAENCPSQGEKVASLGYAGRHVAVPDGDVSGSSLRAGAGDKRGNTSQECVPQECVQQEYTPQGYTPQRVSEQGRRVVQHASRSAGDAAFDGAGWVVRFEPPGYEPSAVRLPSPGSSCQSGAFEGIDGSVPRIVLEGTAQSLPLTIGIGPTFGGGGRGRSLQAGCSGTVAKHRAERDGSSREARA